MFSLSRVLLITIATSSFSAFANSHNTFDYMGLSVQNDIYTDLNFAPSLESGDISPLALKANTTAKGARGFIGHHFNRFLALEAGVTSYGTANFSVTDPNAETSSKVKKKVLYKGEFKTLASDIRIIGTYSLTEKLFVKTHLGALVWNNELTNLAKNQDGLFLQNKTKTGASVLAGFGIGYGFSNKLAMGLDFETTNINDVTTRSIRLSLSTRL